MNSTMVRAAANKPASASRARITAVGAATAGALRLTVDPTDFPPGYQGNRVVLVSAARRSVFYVCEGADGTLDAAGNGKSTTPARAPRNRAASSRCRSR